MKSTEKIRKDLDFRRVYGNRNSIANRYLILYVKENNLLVNRVGFTVSKKVGKATVRNLVKRRMREGFRNKEKRFKLGYDLVFVARNTAQDATGKEIESAIVHLMKKKKLTV